MVHSTLCPSAHVQAFVSICLPSTDSLVYWSFSLSVQSSSVLPPSLLPSFHLSTQPSILHPFICVSIHLSTDPLIYLLSDSPLSYLFICTSVCVCASSISFSLSFPLFLLQEMKDPVVPWENFTDIPEFASSWEVGLVFKFSECLWLPLNGFSFWFFPS